MDIESITEEQALEILTRWEQKFRWILVVRTSNDVMDELRYMKEQGDTEEMRSRICAYVMDRRKRIANSMEETMGEQITEYVWYARDEIGNKEKGNN